MARLTERGRMLCIPLDHGVSVGPIKGLDAVYDTIRQVERGGATAILSHKGILRALPRPPRLGLIMHVSASTSIGPAPNRKVKVGSVEEAVRLGADGVSVHINIGAKEEPEMLAKLGEVADSCDEWQMPCIAMMYPRGENIKDPNDPAVLAHAARIGAELGADIVKTPYSGDADSFRSVVRSCPVKVVIAGGPKADTDRDILEMAEGAIRAGAIGVTFGRNVFQHPAPEKIVQALARVVLRGVSVREALRVVGQ